MSKSTSALTLVAYFVGWYACNAGYNVFNAFVKSDLGFPYVIAVVQLAVGMIYAIPLWILGLRKSPSLTFYDILILLPIGNLQHA